MNVEIGTGATKFLFWEYLFQIFSNGSLQCEDQNWSYLANFTAWIQIQYL